MIRTTEESHERKAKGESLQLWVRDYLRNLPNIHDPEMIQSQKMSTHGEDILIEDEVRKHLPVSIECKKSKTGFAKTYAAMEQAIRQAAAMGSVLDIIPLVYIQQDGHEPLMVIRPDDGVKLFFGNMTEEEDDANEIH
ncbi:hypothetical protein N9301_09160 [Paracoccaceae bacterium]|jgi:hypothetical protein|nr:hypothetical protein [Paracoccaceae bacterium]